ncbi:MAG: phosphatase PAP2 family protein [Candidatus Paceibacterota bacterium]|jgi:membrane-associated phospholipid phosphatase
MLKFIPIISVVSLSLLTVFLVTLVPDDSLLGEGTRYYLEYLWHSLWGLNRYILTALIISLIGYLFWNFLKFSTKGGPGRFKEEIISRLRHLKGSFGEIFWYLLPSLACIILSSLALTPLNQISSVRLRDGFLMGIDSSLTGVYPSFYLASIDFPNWLTQSIIFSFDGLAVFLSLAAIYVFFEKRELFRQLCAAMCAMFLLMFPLWMIFPALSPQDRYIDNIYNLPVSAAISEQVSSYDPAPAVGEFLERVRAQKDESNSPFLPTSTMPSAHTAWILMLGYYVFRVRKAAGLIFAPVVVLTILGTVFLAQHYFIDIVGGITVCSLSIAAISFIRKS